MFELSDVVHRFHQDTSREIWKRYATTHLEPAVALAVAAGLLRKEELAELVQHIAGLIEFTNTMSLHRELLRAVNAGRQIRTMHRPGQESADSSWVQPARYSFVLNPHLREHEVSELQLAYPNTQPAGRSCRQPSRDWSF
jgi:hypothetical protein